MQHIAFLLPIYAQLSVDDSHHGWLLHGNETYDSSAAEPARFFVACEPRVACRLVVAARICFTLIWPFFGALKEVRDSSAHTQVYRRGPYQQAPKACAILTPCEHKLGRNRLSRCVQVCLRVEAA